MNPVSKVVTAQSCSTTSSRIDDAVVVIEGGFITEVGPREAVSIPSNATRYDFPDACLVPGLVDIHIHGGGGHDVMEGTPEAFTAVETLIARHGVTAYLPTTVTASVDTTLHALEKIADHIERGDSRGARPAGIHLEGPFISHAKRGVHPPKHIQAPSLELFERFWQAARGHVKLMTVAAELPGAEELISAARARGVAISLGHSDAKASEAQRAINAGARHATHTFNAMRALDHREPGILGAILTDDRTSAEIIADGVHVAPEIIRLFLKAKGRERAVLVTDAMSATGMPDGTYMLGSFEVEVRNNVALSEGKLAGSVLTLDRAVRNVMQMADWPLADTVRLASLNPAQVVGLNAGEIKPGAPADIAVMSSSGDVIKTFVGGALL